MIAIPDEPVQRLNLSCVPWSSYEAFLEALGERHIRVTYDRGDLEIMTLGHSHEFSKTLLGRLIEMLTFVLNIAIHSGGSTTCKREVLEKGPEPDECYWTQN